jgi:dienelactone hydrolase
MDLERIDYADGDTALTGWLARPVGALRGAVVVFPTIMNVNEPMERRAAMLADAGFLALIADFYGAPVRDFAHSRELADGLRADVDRYRRRVGAGVAALRAVAGDLTLSAARAGENLALVASFHGILSTDRPAQAPITARLLVCHGDADPMVPREQVIGFWQEMDRVQANWHFHSYSGVRHGFTDPGSDGRAMAAIGYDASADRQSWAALIRLLDEIYA